MTQARFTMAPLLIILVAMSGCCQGDPDRPREAVENGQQFLLCGRLVDDREEEEFGFGQHRFKRRGFVVERLGKASKVSRFGAISGVEEWNDPNRENIKALLGWFKSRQVDALIVAGGVGSNRETILNVLKLLAESELPILPLIGASADFAGYRRAVTQAQKQHKNIIDLTTVRLLRWGGVDLVSLPGYYNPFYLGSRRGGCAYTETDVQAIAELLDDSQSPVLLVSSGPPRGRGRKAIDRARGGVNIGDPQLSKLMGEGSVPFGIFGHVYESGGSATSDVDGQRRVLPNQWSKSLYLNPGAAESVPYDLTGGGRSRGMGAVLEIGESGGRYELHFLERLPLRTGAPSR